MALPSIGSSGSDRLAVYMNGGQFHTGQFGDASLTPPHSEGSLSAQTQPQQEGEPEYKLIVRQEPQRARVALGKEKDRKPIDPPPIVQLIRSTRADPTQIYLQSPYYFMACTLVKANDDDPDPNPNSMLGTLVSSLHKLRDTDNRDAGFFIFGDLSIKVEGVFRLQFTLFQMKDSCCVHLDQALSQPFTVFPQKSFEGMAESTFLTRSFSDQGVRLRVRKDSRAMTTRKRNHQHAEAAAARKHHAAAEWDQRHRAVSRQQQHDGDATPTDPRPFATTGYYDRYADYDYYTDHRPSKRSRVASGDVGSPAAYALPDLSGYTRPTPAYADPVATALSMPPVTSAAPAAMTHHHQQYAAAHPHPSFAAPHPPPPSQPHRINTSVGPLAATAYPSSSPHHHHSAFASPAVSRGYHHHTPVSLAGLETYASVGIAGGPNILSTSTTSSAGTSPHLAGPGYRHGGMVNDHAP